MSLGREVLRERLKPVLLENCINTGVLDRVKREFMDTGMLARPI